MPRFNDNEQNKRIDEIKRKEEESFVERIASKFNLPYIDLSGVNIETDALILINEETSRRAQIAAFKKIGQDLYVAVKSPNLPETKKVLEKLEQTYRLGIHMVSQRSLEKAWDRFQDVSKAETTQGGMLDISQEELASIAKNVQSNDDVAQKVKEVLQSDHTKKVTELMEVVFGGAIATKASDIHIEAQDEEVRLRYRQDGVLQDIVNIDHETYKKLLSRIKLLSQMKITQKSNAQDGRFTIDFDDKEIEVRVSVIPSAYGESFVMRILNPDGIKVGIENLGIEPKLYEILLKEIKKPNGMILTTGPTGSGKTTTLYSFLGKVYNPEVKILTIEDPIEYHLGGISQTQVDRDKGYDFLSGLRAALRQDPDIVMVGEIRDKETATIAVNASLTGHLVLSTLHTNGAAGVIPRLIDLGVSPQILAAALSVSLAQRLVRKVCTKCSVDVEANPQEQQLITKILTRAQDNGKKMADYGVSRSESYTIKKAQGCEACNGTGYKGRIGIFEAIITDESIEELLNKEPSEQEVRRVAEKQGLLNMAEDGIVKILKGVTTLSEVQSVVDLEVKEGFSAQNNEEQTEVPVEKPRYQPQVINTSQNGVQFLLEYLQELEHQQTIDPSVDVSQKIHDLEHTIIDMLKNQGPQHFNKVQEAQHTHQKVNHVLTDIKDLREHHEKQSDLQTAPKLKQIREHMESIVS